MDELDGSTVEPEETTQTEVSADAEVPAEETVDETPEAEAETAVDEDADLQDLSNWTVEDAVARLRETRQEAASYRTERNQFKDSFEGFSEEDTQAFLDAVKLLQTDPAEAYPLFKNLISAIAEEAGITEAEAEAQLADELNTETPVVDDANEVITRGELRAFVAQQKADEEAKAAEQAKADAAAQVKAEVDAQIAELGYKEGTKAFNDLMYFANSIEEGSVSEKLAAADAQVKADRQAVIDEFLAEQAAQSDIAPAQSDGASPAPTREQPTSIKDSTRAAREYLDAVYGDDDE